MQISSTHMLENCSVLHSPNCDERPSDEEPSLLVLHGISLPPGEFGTGMVERLFLNKLDQHVLDRFESLKNMRVSSHLFVGRDGAITQFVPFNKRAWHAGESSFRGRSQCNDFSIGIEIEGTDELDYDVRQYEVLVVVLQTILRRYPAISLSRIVGHAEIAPGRKTDPGPSFDWQHLFRQLRSQIG